MLRRTTALLSTTLTNMRVIVAMLLVASFAGPVLAAPPPVSEDVRLPGGVAGMARALGLEPSFDRASAAAEFTRLIHSVEEGRNAETDARLRELEAYLTTVTQFQTSLDRLEAATRGISLQKAATGMSGGGSKRCSN